MSETKTERVEVVYVRAEVAGTPAYTLKAEASKDKKSEVQSGLCLTLCRSKLRVCSVRLTLSAATFCKMRRLGKSGSVYEHTQSRYAFHPPSCHHHKMDNLSKT